MDNSQSSAPLAARSRLSALPRLSKLPLPGHTPSFSSHHSNPSSSEEDVEDVLHNSAALNDHTSQQSAISKSSISPVSPPKRQPLGPPQRPQSKQEPARQIYSDAREFGRSTTFKAPRYPSQQENTFQPLDSSEESDGQGNARLYRTLSAIKKPRPSLADRTVESISQVSPSPGRDRRRSDFFNPQSPITPVRPKPAKSNTSVPRAQNGGATMTSFGFNRPESPSKGAALSRASLSSGLPRSNLPAPNTTTSIQNQSSPRKTAITGIPSTKGQQHAMPSHGRSMSMIAKPSQIGAPRPSRVSQVPSGSAKTISSTQPKTNYTSTHKKLPSFNSKPVKTVSKESIPESQDLTTTSPTTKSSAALRAHIAKARAAQNNRAHQSKDSTSTTSTSAANSIDFEDSEDPFNQKPKGEVDPLRKRIDSARADGRLNIAAMSLKSIPDEVLKMYDADQMESSSLIWSETVDLIRFCAADNDIEEIKDDVFPDLTKEALSDESAAKGNQFGGLEHLDLHGNVLKSLPVGLRRLEKLTFLNLARNKLDNSVFATLTQLHGLRTLNLSSNELTKDLPDSISLLFSLESLHLQSNKLSQLPASIRELTSLRTLDVSTNRLSSLPMPELGALPKLQEFNASHNALTGAFFPLSFSGFLSLSNLDVCNNALASLTFSPTPPAMPCLKNLNVSQNRLVMFPDIGEWVSLKVLLAADNMLTTLPEGFAKLGAELRSADFAGNAIRNIEDGVASMTALEWLELQGNPLLQKKYLTMSTEDMKGDIAKRLEVDKAFMALTGESNDVSDDHEKNSY